MTNLPISPINPEQVRVIYSSHQWLFRQALGSSLPKGRACKLESSNQTLYNEECL